MTKIIAIPTRICYNNGIEAITSEHYPKVKVVKNAKRNKKFTYFRRGKAPYSLRWHLSSSLVLQKTQVEMVFSELCKIPQTFHPLPCCGSGVRDTLTRAPEFSVGGGDDMKAVLPIILMLIVSMPVCGMPVPSAPPSENVTQSPVGGGDGAQVAGIIVGMFLVMAGMNAISFASEDLEKNAYEFSVGVGLTTLGGWLIVHNGLAPWGY